MLNKQIQRESKSEVISVWEEVEEGVNCLLDSVWGEKVLKVDNGDGHPTFWVYLIPLNCTLSNG